MAKVNEIDREWFEALGFTLEINYKFKGGYCWRNESLGLTVLEDNSRASVVQWVRSAIIQRERQRTQALLRSVMLPAMGIIEGDNGSLRVSYE